MILSRVLERACCELNPRWFPAEGEEAVVAGAFFGLRPDDVAAPHYRGPFLAYAMRGASLSRLVAQALAKSSGYARGRALGFTGPADLGFVPWVAGDLGTTIGVATGCAVGFQYERSDRVVVCSFGDGTTNRGDFHEALNLAAVWKLPIVYVCQNNQYSISLHASEVLPIASVAARGGSYGMPSISLDGNDVIAVHWAVREAIARARTGGGPTLIEACTYRLGGHWASDPGGYRLAEVEQGWRARDPVPRAVSALIDAGYIDEVGVAALWDEARLAVDAAVVEAKRASDPSMADMGEHEVLAPHGRDDRLVPRPNDPLAGGAPWRA
jgi:TPP-dependent pyruvate/acetoin dehydrogenase alpha subunit